MKTGVNIKIDAGAGHICYCRLNDIVLLCGFLECAETLKFQRLQGVQQIYRCGICTMLRYAAIS